MFAKKTVREIELDGKTVLVRADYNVQIGSDGQIEDDFRIEQSIPTLQYLLEKNCKVVICSHLGRPDGPNDPKSTLRPVAVKLADMLGKEITFVRDCIGDPVKVAAERVGQGQVLLLENVRYHEEEEKNDESFARKIVEATGAEIFVQDGFGVVHRKHATTDAITRVLPSVAGLLLEREVDTITNVMQNPDRPLVAIVGGAKISDKIEVLNRLIDIADIVAVGGAMANTFLKAKGIEVAKSKIDEDDLETAKQVMERAAEKAENQNFVFYLPQDGVVANKVDRSAKTRIVDWSAHVVADVDNYPKRPPNEASQLNEDEMILDIGPFSGAFIAGTLQLAQTVVWNGTMGVAETDGVQGPVGPFAHGTELVVEAMAGQFGHKPFSLVGGGDTASYISEHKMTGAFNHVSTGGGASLELMAGIDLPGVAALQDRES